MIFMHADVTDNADLRGSGTPSPLERAGVRGKENHCGECLSFGFEDLDGFGYCAKKDIRTYCGGIACGGFSKQETR